jgi:hypothetical protein
MTESEQDFKLCKDAAEKLGEHFDSVQILATRHSGGENSETVSMVYGVGNWFARYGQAKDWVVKSDSRTHRSVMEENE